MSTKPRIQPIGSPCIFTLTKPVELGYYKVASASSSTPPKFSLTFTESIHSNLSEHKRIHMENRPEKPIKELFCHCGKVFRTQRDLDWHKVQYY